MSDFKWNRSGPSRLRKCPCKGCEERTPTCHGGCEKYRDFLSVVAKEREMRMKEEKICDYRWGR